MSVYRGIFGEVEGRGMIQNRFWSKSRRHR